MNERSEPTPALARLIAHMQTAGAGELRHPSPASGVWSALRTVFRPVMRIGLLLLALCAIPASLRFGRAVLAPWTQAGFAAELWRWVLGRQATARLLAPLVHRFMPIIVLPPGLTQHLFGLTFVVGYDDVQQTLGNDQALRVSTYDVRMTRTSGSFLLGHDGELHAQGRHQALHDTRDGRHDQDGPRVIELARSASEALVATAAERPTRSIDVVSELGNVVPLYVAHEYFGVEDTEDVALLSLLQTMSFYLFNFWIGGPYEVSATEAAARLRLHLRAVIDERLRSTGDLPDDVLQRVIDRTQSSAAGEPLSEQAKDGIASHLLGLLSGSIVATVGTFLNAVMALLELPPDRRAELQRACRGETPSEVLDHWVTEACRVGGAFPPMLYRVAAEDVALAPGTPHTRMVARGSYVVSVQWLANLDPRRYPLPWRLRPERFTDASPAPPPMLFGAGVHRCLAEHLGQAIIREMIRALFARPNVRRASGADGVLKRGRAGVTPDGNFAQRLVLCFDA